MCPRSLRIQLYVCPYVAGHSAHETQLLPHWMASEVLPARPVSTSLLPHRMLQALKGSTVHTWALYCLKSALTSLLPGSYSSARRRSPSHSTRLASAKCACALLYSAFTLDGSFSSTCAKITDSDMALREKRKKALQS